MSTINCTCHGVDVDLTVKFFCFLACYFTADNNFSQTTCQQSKRVVLDLNKSSFRHSLSSYFSRFRCKTDLKELCLPQWCLFPLHLFIFFTFLEEMNITKCLSIMRMFYQMQQRKLMITKQTCGLTHWLNSTIQVGFMLTCYFQFLVTFNLDKQILVLHVTLYALAIRANRARYVSLFLLQSCSTQWQKPSRSCQGCTQKI